jgi:CspA family cold shock protein
MSPGVVVARHLASVRLLAWFGSLEEYEMLKTGTVKWFNNAKGYGFLREDDNPEDIFVHYSAIEGDGFKTLKQGERVGFEVETGPKGLLASRVQRLD